MKNELESFGSFNEADITLKMRQKFLELGLDGKEATRLTSLTIINGKAKLSEREQEEYDILIKKLKAFSKKQEK